MSFTRRASALDGTEADPGQANAVVIDPVGDIAVAVGSSFPYDTTQKIVVRSDDGGVTWTAPSNPFNFDGADPGTDVCWSPSLGLFLVTGDNGNDTPYRIVMTSPDGTTWTSRSSPLEGNFYPTSCCWSPALGLFLVACGNTSGVPHESLMTSPDGITWTARSSPLDDKRVYSVCWSQALGLFVAVGQGGPTKYLITSPDGIVWTAHTTPWGSNAGAVGQRVAWCPVNGVFLAVGFSNSPFAEYLISSTDGSTWTDITPAGNSLDYPTYFSERSDGAILAGNLLTGSPYAVSIDGGLTWAPVYAPLQSVFGIASGGSFDTILAGISIGQSTPDFTGAIANGVSDAFVIVDPASSITSTSAILNGRVSPQGVDSEAYFEYGPTTAYGQTTPAVLIGNGTDYVTVGKAISGLTGLTTYHYRVARAAAAAPPVPPNLGNLLPPRLSDSGGSIVNVGTLAQLLAAMNAAPNDGIVNIAADINGGGATWTVGRNAVPGGTVTVTCDPGVQLTNFSQIDIRGSFLRFRGLDVSAALIDNFKINVNAHDIEIDGCDIYNAVRQGILISPSPYNIQIWNNKIHGNGSTLNLDHGIYWGYARGNCVLANNLFYDNWAYNVQLYPDCPNLIFTCNTVDGGQVHANSRGGVVVGSESGLTDNIIVVGLISTNAAYYGIHPYDPAGGDTNNNVYDSIGFGNGLGDFGTGGGMAYINCLHADPLYVGGGDYHLQGGSPAIDLCALRAGYVPPFDIEGTPRVTADAGCYAA